MTLKELFETKQKIDPHVVYPLLPMNGMLLLVAEEKSGKSMLVGNVMYQLGGGLPIFGLKQYQPKQAWKVQYFDQENGAWLVKKRLAKVHMALESDFAIHNVDVVPMDLQLSFDTQRGRAGFWQHVDRFEPNVVVLDTIGKFHVHDESKYTEMNKMYSPIRAEFQKRNISVIMVHHMNKPGEFRSGMGLNRARGAYWVAEASSIVMMKRNGRTSPLAELEITLRSEMSPPKISLTYDKVSGLFMAKQKVEIVEDGE